MCAHYYDRDGDGNEDGAIEMESGVWTEPLDWPWPTTKHPNGPKALNYRDWPRDIYIYTIYIYLYIYLDVRPEQSTRRTTGIVYYYFNNLFCAINTIADTFISRNFRQILWLSLIYCSAARGRVCVVSYSKLPIVDLKPNPNPMPMQCWRRFTQTARGDLKISLAKNDAVINVCPYI